MKVTKVVKEAINSSIQNKADARIQELEAQKLLEKEPLEALEVDFKTCIYRAIKDWFEQTDKTHPRIKYRSYDYGNHNEMITLSQALLQIKEHRPRMSNFYIELTTPEIENLNKEISAIKQAVGDKTNEIVLALELGDKKQTVQDLLDQVKF